MRRFFIVIQDLAMAEVQELQVLFATFGYVRCGQAYDLANRAIAFFAEAGDTPLPLIEHPKLACLALGVPADERYVRYAFGDKIGELVRAYNADFAAAVEHTLADIL